MGAFEPISETELYYLNLMDIGYVDFTNVLIDRCNNLFFEIDKTKIPEAAWTIKQDKRQAALDYIFYTTAADETKEYIRINKDTQFYFKYNTLDYSTINGTDIPIKGFAIYHNGIMYSTYSGEYLDWSVFRLELNKYPLQDEYRQKYIKFNEDIQKWLLTQIREKNPCKNLISDSIYKDTYCQIRQNEQENIAESITNWWKMLKLRKVE